MKEYILFVIAFFGFSVNFSFAQKCNCSDLSVDKRYDYNNIKQCLTTRADSAIVDKISKKKRDYNYYSTLMDTVLKKYCKQLLGTKWEAFTEQRVKFEEKYPRSKVKDINFEELKYEVTCSMVNFKLHQPESHRATNSIDSLQKVIISLKSNLDTSKKLTSIMRTTTYLFSVIGAILAAIIALILLSYIKNKKIKILEDEIAGQNDSLINYINESMPKSEYEKMKENLEALEVQTKTEKDRNRNLEEQLQLSLQKTVESAKISTSPINKTENVFRLFAQIPHGDIFQRVQENFISYESIFEIITDNNKKTGKFRLVSDEETAKYAFDLIDQLKGAAYLNGIGKPANLGQVQQREGKVEFIGDTWKIVYKMTLTW